MNDSNIKKLEEENKNKNLKEILNEIKKNQTNEINKLKEDLNKYKKENVQLKSNLDKYQKENDKLQEGLINAKKVISDLLKNQNNQMNNNELKSLRDEIEKLNKELTLKENELKDLKKKIQNNSLENVKINYKDIKFVTFVSMNSTVQCGIKCLSKDASGEMKEKLQNKNNNIKDANNMLLAKSKPILSFEKINKNNIKDGKIHQLFKIE